MGTWQSKAGAFPALLREVEAATSAGSRYYSSARTLLVATLLAAPLAFGAVQPWAWAALYVLAFLSTLLWAIACVRQGAVRIVWSPLYWPAALFLLVGAVQYFGHLTADNYGSREALIKLVTDLLFFFLAVQLFGDCSHRTWRIFGLAVTFYGFLMGLFAILQSFSSHGLIYWVVKSPGATFGPYVNHNDYAGLMEMLIPIAAAYVLSRPRTDQHKFLLAFAVCVPIGSILLSASRGGLVSLLGEAVIFAGILWKRTPAHRQRNPLLICALGVIAVALFFFWMAPRHVTSRLGTVANVVHSPEATYGDRMHVAYDSLLILRNHPILGTGLGSFGSVFPAYQSFPTNQLYPYAHNDYAQALAETGAVGALIILWSLILFFRLAFRNLRKRLEVDVGWIRLGAALGVCGLLIHSFVDFNLHIPANAAWFAVCIALSTSTAPSNTAHSAIAVKTSAPDGGIE